MPRPRKEVAPYKRLRQLKKQIEKAKTKAELEQLRDAISRIERAVHQSKIIEARKDPVAFIEFAFKDTKNKPLVSADLHYQWHAAIHHENYNPDGFKRVLIIAPRNHGKCVPDDALVTVDDGSRVRAIDLPKTFRVRSWSESAGWEICDARKWRQHEQDLIQVITDSGRSERVSIEHPFWTSHGWVSADQLVHGDFVSVCRNAASDHGQHFSTERAWLLGVLIGGGGLTQPSRVGLTIADDKLVAAVADLAALCKWTFRNKTPSKPGIEWSLSSRDLLAWLRKLGLHGKGSHGKYVPEVVFTWNRSAVAAFIAGYLETDGSVTDGAAGRAVEFYSVSRRLLEGVQSLLIRHGIQTKLSKKNGRYKGKRHISWRLSVCGTSIDTLAVMIDDRGPKAKRLKDLRARMVRNDSFDLIPEEIVRLIPGSFSRAKPRLDSRRKRGHVRWKVLDRACGLTHIENNAQLAWERVVSARPAGRERTWSIEVYGTHVHLVGDFVTHNTTQIPVGRAIWEIGNNPNLRIKIVCQSDTKAMERLFEVVDNLERNQRVIEVFPHLKPAARGDWTKHKIVVDRNIFSKDASIEALGVMSTATGGRADLLIADDIVDRRNALQFPQLRETIKHAWKSDWTNLLEPEEGRIIYICTLWHTADNSHELMTNAAYAVLEHSIDGELASMDAKFTEPATADGVRQRHEWNEPLWEHWKTESLRERQLEIGSVEFDRAFRNIALSGEVAVVQPGWIEYFDSKKMPLELEIFQGYDLAISKRQHADYFACVTVGMDPFSQTVYVLDAWRGKLSFTQQANAIIDEYVKWKPGAVVIESVGYQESLPQYLDSIAGDVEEIEQMFDTVTDGSTTLIVPKPITKVIQRVPLLPLIQVKPRFDKMSRLKRVTPYMERGKILFSSNMDPQNPGISDRGDLITELCQFPLAPKDDMVDAFVHVVSHVVRQGVESSFNEEPELMCTVRTYA